MTVEIRVTTPMSAPRRMPQPPMQMPHLSSSVVFSLEEGLPQGTLSTATAVFFSCMLKKPRKRQMSYWVCFLLTQYLQECCLILEHHTHLSPKNLHALVRFIFYSRDSPSYGHSSCPFPHNPAVQ